MHHRLSIEGELRALQNEKEQASADTPISWNHTEFQVCYYFITPIVGIFLLGVGLFFAGPFFWIHCPIMFSDSLSIAAGRS